MPHPAVRPLGRRFRRRRHAAAGARIARSRCSCRTSLRHRRPKWPTLRPLCRPLPLLARLRDNDPPLQERFKPPQPSEPLFVTSQRNPLSAIRPPPALSRAIRASHSVPPFRIGTQNLETPPSRARRAYVGCVGIIRTGLARALCPECLVSVSVAAFYGRANGQRIASRERAFRLCLFALFSPPTQRGQLRQLRQLQQFL
jgi:hypothetical protein